MSGRGTAGGVVFQSEVGAYAAGLLLSERPLTRLGASLLGTPRSIKFETPHAVDDLLIETDLGSAYVQAKRTISLSAQPDSELASVADQFVRQFRSGIVESGLRRDFLLLRDRLVLAVSSDTTGPIRENLRAVLDRVRTGAATALPAALQTALDTFTDLLEAAWIAQTGAAITDGERQALLSVCAVAEIGYTQRQLVEEGLRDIAPAGGESALIELLTAWAATSSQNGVGGDGQAIRHWLIGKISLRQAPSLQDDVRRLTEDSNRVLTRLERFTTLLSPEGPVSFQRPVTDAVVDAVRNGSLALTGEPGAGKSAIIHAAASKLGSDAMVVTLTVEASATSLDALRRDLGLDRPIIELFAQIATDRPCYLLIDALDAVRGGTAEATYKRLVEEVSQLPGWRVLASIRTFDLRLGKEWRRLFAGTAPNASYADRTFPTVRHIHVGLLGADEKQDIAAQSPSLEAAIQFGGDKLEHLACNPFNLALLGDLLRGGVAVNTLSSVTTRGQLLDRYWEERVGELGLVATTSLTSLVSSMLSARAIDIPETSVPVTNAVAIDDLQRVGVLITEATRRIAFRHHILFDFAIAKLILLPDQTIAAQHLSRVNGAGLLIVASLGYWLEALSTRLARSEFWRFVLKIVGENTFDPIVRVDVARLAVENVEADDASFLTDEILRLNPTTNNAFLHLTGSLISRLKNQQRTDISLWANILERLGVPAAPYLGSVRSLLLTIVETSANAVSNTSLGAAARNLFDAMSDDPGRISWLAPVVIPIVAKTWATNPEESRMRLASIFEEGRFDKFAYIEVPWLARESLSVAPHDPDFIVNLFYRAFRGGNFSHDHVTSMNNSWIMGLNSNAAQDFQSALYSLVRDFPKLLDQYPETALRAFAAALCGEQERAHPVKSSVERSTVSISGEPYSFLPDMSAIWAWEFAESDHDNLAKMYQAVVQWAPTPAATSLTATIPSLIVPETGIAIAWRSLLSMGAASPDTLGLVIWQAAISPTVLTSLDTLTEAVLLVGATYSFLTREQRAAVETAVLDINFSDDPEPNNARNEVLGRLFEAIGLANLVTSEAQSFLTSIKADGSTFENRRPYECRVTSGPSRHWLEHSGVDVRAPAVSYLLTLAESVRNGCRGLNDTAASTNTVWQDVTALKKAVADAETINPLLDQDISDALANGLGACLLHHLIPSQDRTAALIHLIELSKHIDPAPLSEDDERQFAEFPSWGAPAPRIEAAQQIAALVCQAEFWPLLQDRFEELLLTDGHPAVRLQLIRALHGIYQIDADAMWLITEKMIATEKNGALIKDLIVVLSYVRREDYPRVESLVLPLVAMTLPERGDDPLTGLLVSFAVDRDMTPSRAILDGWIANFETEEKRLHAALFDLRSCMIIGLDDEDEDKANIRRRTLAVLWSLVDKLEPAVRSLSLSENPPTQEELVALKLFGEIADQIFYAVGHDQLTPELATLKSQKQFLLEFAPLISKLSTLGTPRAVHHLLSVLNMVVDSDPGQCFDLFAEAMLRTTGVSRYEYESMGADFFVQLVGLYLADHRELFDDEMRRKKLIDCIALFVETGWPEARRLFQSLPELLQ